MDCIFCKIITGIIPSYTLYEDEVVKAFLDISPDSNGHCLIVPKNHTVDLFTIDDDTLSHISKVSRIVSNLLNEKLKPISIKIVQNNGDLQEVKHYHMHVIPYYNNQIKLPVCEVFNIIKNPID